jgi:uncharacterized protein (DUF885 family)
MKKLIFLLAVISTLFASCRNGGKPITTAAGDEKFRQLSEDFLSGYLAWRPELSVYLGFHEYDGKTGDLSMGSLSAELARLKSYDQMLDEFDTAALSRKAQYDFRILQHGVKSEMFYIEDMGSYTKNPMTYAYYLDFSIYIKRNFAPLEERLKSIIAVEKNIPGIFTAARSNLEDSLARPFIEIAVQIVRGTAGFLENDLVKGLRDIRDDSLMAVFRRTNDIAISEVRAFAGYLEKEKLPKANNNYELGRENYRKMLLCYEGITMPPEEILEIGLRELKREQDVFNAAAEIISPGKKPVEVLHEMQKEHPTSERLISDVSKKVEAIRQFLIDKKIVTIPSEARVQVKETPEYYRSLGFAMMDPPGSFEKKATEAFYYITLPDPAWSAREIEDWLSAFNYYTSDLITIHEAYPGHYIQLSSLNASSATKIEKIFGSYAFIEGWAHYAEKMMIDEGYGNSGDPAKAAKYRIAQSCEALVRLCRLCVSIKMHVEGMSVDDATKFFMDNWYHGEKPSYEEAKRATYDPGYLFYTLGKLMMLKLRQDFQKQEGDNFTLLKFHDLMLNNGMPQIKILREEMLKDKNIWNKIL